MESLESFYDDETRQVSREVSFGSLWRSAGAPHYQFTVFWVADTKELCVERTPIKDVQQDGTFRRWVLGLPPHFRSNPLADNEVTVRVLCRLDEDELHAVLSGWEEQIGAPDGLSWLIARALGSNRKDDADEGYS